MKDIITAKRRKKIPLNNARNTVKYTVYFNQGLIISYENIANMIKNKLMRSSIKSLIFENRIMFTRISVLLFT
ncbi:MAG: hypothetical protein ACQUHE_10795, partial [Bacteroidia bacterium]